MKIKLTYTPVKNKRKYAWLPTKVYNITNEQDYLIWFRPYLIDKSDWIGNCFRFIKE